METQVKILKGRGAVENPPNRFAKIQRVKDEEWNEADDPGPQTVFYKDSSRTALTRNDSPDVGFSTSLNPYRGCEHGCSYCFARPTHEYFDLSSGIDFETKIFVKQDAPQLLRKELSSRSWEPQPVIMSGVTDPYQPVERRLMITRRCLEVFAEFRNPVSIITKNYLVTRDIDVLARLADFQAATVNISITTLDPKLARVLEPRAAHPLKRLQAVRELSAAGIPVNVMVAPIIPAVNDHEIPAILNAVKEAGARSAGYVFLRLPYAVAPLFTQWLERHFPDRKDKVLNRIRESRGGKLYDSNYGTRYVGDGHFSQQIRDMFYIARKRARLDDMPELSTEHFCNPDDKQLKLL